MRFLPLLLAVVLVVPACSATGSSGTVTVLASWLQNKDGTGEGDRFREVLDAFESKENIKVNYVGTRALTQVLQSEVLKGTPPDIAVLSSPGELASLARQQYVKPLDTIVAQPEDQYSKQWQELEKVGRDKRYGVAIKADLKSLVWFNPSRTPRPPDGFGLTGYTWCGGLGGTPDSGWPGTDWIEDILLHQAGPEAYRKWASGQPQAPSTLAVPPVWNNDIVRRAWSTWGEVLAKSNPRSVLLTDFGDAGRPLFAGTPGCGLDHQPSFIAGVYQGYDEKPLPGKDFDFTAFPGLGSTTKSWEVSADMAAMFNDTEPARKLISFLAGPEAQRIWPGRGGAFSVNRKVEPAVYPNDVSKRIAGTLTASDTLCFDASDLMPATVRTAFYRAVLEYVNAPDREQRLPGLLAELDQVSASLSDEWLEVRCGTG
ncbi:ABC transporter substrate-binding protein [Actinocrispum sp. NPDC049592]|uniref:ABC transporter substrate-binding protein n=1 Tax=Actinocrispum sp. NPDC049592 TaxID=3154835 RepID=UPI0034459D2B